MDVLIDDVSVAQTGRISIPGGSGAGTMLKVGEPSENGSQIEWVWDQPKDLDKGRWQQKVGVLIGTF